MPSVSREDLAAWRTAFGRRLRELREGAGLSQEALAERAGVDRKMIYRTELGQTSPRLDAIFRLASAMGLSVSGVTSIEEAHR